MIPMNLDQRPAVVQDVRIIGVSRMKQKVERPVKLGMLLHHTIQTTILLLAQILA
jgi:hypothetical protein